MDLFDSATVSLHVRPLAPAALLIENKWCLSGFGAASECVADVRQVL